MPLTDPVFYFFAIPAVLLYGMAKGGLGGAAGAIAVPMMALAIDPVKAAAILLPIICVMDAFAVKTFWRQYDLPSLKIIIPTSLIGIVVGAMLLGSLSTSWLQVLIGGISILFCLFHWCFEGKWQAHATSPLSGYFWGAVAGFTSTQIHAGGPPVSIYLMPKNLDKFILIGTLAVFFAVLNYIKIIPYALLGQFDYANLATSLVLVPLAPIGVKLGYIILKRTSQTIIYRILYLALFASGLKLVFDGMDSYLVL